MTTKKVQNQKNSAQNKRINWANVMVFLRFALIPFIVICLFSKDFRISHFLACGLYAVACITDFFDGRWARKHNMVSDLGRILDPIADKVAVLIILLVLAKVRMGIFEICLASLIVFREVFVSGLREFMEGKGITIKVTKLAKWKTTFQMIAITCLILGLRSFNPAFILSGAWKYVAYYMILIYLVGTALLCIATILTVITGWQYFAGAKKHFK